jgi:hypothetical protein
LRRGSRAEAKAEKPGKKNRARKTGEKPGGKTGKTGRKNRGKNRKNRGQTERFPVFRALSSLGNPVTCRLSTVSLSGQQNWKTFRLSPGFGCRGFGVKV